MQWQTANLQFKVICILALARQSRAGGYGIDANARCQCLCQRFCGIPEGSLGKRVGKELWVQLPDPLVDDVDNKTICIVRQSFRHFFGKNYRRFQMNCKMTIPKLHIQIANAIIFKQRCVVNEHTNRTELRCCLLQQSAHIVLI
ncbi:hypothetical protein FQZ97_1098980 [compost metagenome]